MKAKQERSKVYLHPRRGMIHVSGPKTGFQAKGAWKWSESYNRTHLMVFSIDERTEREIKKKLRAKWFLR